MSNIVNLDESLIIGSGGCRVVYRHPDNANQCLKIKSRQGGGWWCSDSRDIKYYTHLQKRGASFQHVNRFFGEQMTNMGNALIFEMITDYDGQVSNTLKYYLESENQCTIICWF